MSEFATERGESGDYEVVEDVIQLEPQKVEIEWVAHFPTVRIDGKVAAFCRQIDVSLTVEGAKVTLHRYRLKGDPPEERYWADE